MSTAELTTISQEDFESLLTLMEQRDLANVQLIRAGYPVALAPTTADTDLDFAALPPDLQEVVNRYKQGEISATKTLEAECDRDIKGFLDKKLSQEEFEKALLEDETRDIDGYIQRRKDLTARFRELGRKHPDQRADILQVSEALESFFGELFANIAKFVAELVAKIREWLTNAYEKARDFFGRAVDSIGGLFG